MGRLFVIAFAPSAATILPRGRAPARRALAAPMPRAKVLPRLLDTPAIGRVRETPDVWGLPRGQTISRADLVKVAVAKLADPASVRRAIAVAT